MENSTPDTWDWGIAADGTSADKVIDYLAPYLKITKRCGSSGGCFSKDTYKSLNKNVNWWRPEGGSYASAQLANGLTFWLWTGGGCTTKYGNTKELNSVCGAVGVDINGYKKPNQLGRDTFYFYLTKYNVLPMGTKPNTVSTLSSHCRLSNTNADNGYACAAWVIAKDNMDYLHKDVSW